MCIFAQFLKFPKQGLWVIFSFMLLSFPQIKTKSLILLQMMGVKTKRETEKVLHGRTDTEVQYDNNMIYTEHLK